MKLFFRKILLFFGFIILHVYSEAQADFYAVISPDVINKDDLVSYRIVVQDAGVPLNITPPAFKNFTIIRGPVSEIDIHRVNGRITKFVSFLYILKPSKAGKFKIGPASTTVSGRNIRSNGVNLRVNNVFSNGMATVPPYSLFDPLAQAVPETNFSDYIFHDGDDLAAKVNRDMILKLEVDRKSCYVGEPVIANYRLYSRLKSDSKLTQNPSFNGFSVVDLQAPEVTGFSKGTLNGKEYNVYNIRRAQLYALQPGTISLEPAEVENNVQFIKEAYAKNLPAGGGIFSDFPGSFFPPEAVINQQVTLTSQPLDIIVKDLPAENKPVTFNGAVGNFEILAALQRPLFSTEEAGKLSVTITGAGNMQLLTAPDIGWPKGIESFEPKFSENLIRATVPVSGSKNFEYSFTAADSGHYVLPAIQFSYFDVASASYRTIATQPISFQVTKAAGHLADTGAAGKERLSFLNRIFHHRSWIVIFIAAVMLTGLIVWIIRENRRKSISPITSKNPGSAAENLENDIAETVVNNQQNVFAGAEKCLYREDCAGFYSLLNAELKQFLASKFLLEPNLVNTAVIIPVMDKRGIPNEIILALQSLLQDIERQLYSPFDRNEQMEQFYSKAQTIVQRINAHEIRRL